MDGVELSGWNADVGASSADAATGAVTLLDGSCFMVSAANGDLEGGTHGLYLLDTRILSGYRLLVDGQPAEALTTLVDTPFSCRFVGRVHRPGGVADTPLVVVRARSVGNGVSEWVELRNYSAEAATVDIAVTARADFAGVFDVKAGRAVAPRAEGPTEVGAAGTSAVLVLSDGTEDPGWRSEVRSTVAPDRVDADALHWRVTVAAGAAWSCCLEISLRVDDRPLTVSHPCQADRSQAVSMVRLASWRAAAPTVASDDTALVHALQRAQDDLGTLRIFDPTHVERVVVAAGAPWYMTLFGRDSLLTAWMALPLGPDLALGVLRSLADLQGTRHDDTTEEEPGRILHEVRYDRDTRRTLGGHSAYYGSVDATPLFVMLTGELARWGVPLDVLEPLLEPVDRALAWIERRLDATPHGFVFYERSTPVGLRNQAWKDSWDAVRSQDGVVADAPLALAEVQAYAFAAFEARALLATATGDEALARRWQHRAEALRQRFERAFWLEDRGWYAMAVDGSGRPLDALASNVGHCLWAGIVAPERAAALAGHLAGPQLNSGFGLRTLATSAAGFNPLSYHCGSVWPHDTAIAIAGLARYRRDREAMTLARALLDASAAFDGRLPELFAGFDRDEFEVPVRYPASCSPQAWASTAPLLLLRVLLGLQPDIPNGVVGVRPIWPAGLSRLRIDGLWIGGSRVSIDATPQGHQVIGERSWRLDG